MIRKSMAFVVVACLLGHQLEAQGGRDTIRTDTTKLKELIVSARKPITTIGGSSGIELRLDSLGKPVAATLEMILRELPALHVRRNSRGEAELSARGSDSRWYRSWCFFIEGS